MKNAFAPGPGQRHLPLRDKAVLVARPHMRLKQDRQQFRHAVGDFLASEGRRLPAEALGVKQPPRRGIEHIDSAFRINADNFRRHAGQHRFRKQSPLVDQRARRHQVVFLVAQLGGHLVECLAKMGEIALFLADRHLHIEVA